MLATLLLIAWNGRESQHIVPNIALASTNPVCILLGAAPYNLSLYYCLLGAAQNNHSLNLCTVGFSQYKPSLYLCPLGTNQYNLLCFALLGVTAVFLSHHHILFGIIRNSNL